MPVHPKANDSSRVLIRLIGLIGLLGLLELLGLFGFTFSDIPLFISNIGCSVTT